MKAPYVYILGKRSCNSSCIYLLLAGKLEQLSKVIVIEKEEKDFL